MSMRSWSRVKNLDDYPTDKFDFVDGAGRKIAKPAEFKGHVFASPKRAEPVRAEAKVEKKPKRKRTRPKKK